MADAADAAKARTTFGSQGHDTVAVFTMWGLIMFSGAILRVTLLQYLTRGALSEHFGDLVNEIDKFVEQEKNRARSSESKAAGVVEDSGLILATDVLQTKIKTSQQKYFVCSRTLRELSEHSVAPSSFVQIYFMLLTLLVPTVVVMVTKPGLEVDAASRAKEEEELSDYLGYYAAWFAILAFAPLISIYSNGMVLSTVLTVHKVSRD